MDDDATITDAPAQSLRILAADEDTAALEQTAKLLRRLGHQVTACTASVSEACDLIVRDEPDAAVVVVHEDHAHALDLIDEISETASGPVVALVGGQDAGFAEAAARRGISALAAGDSAESLQAALEVAMRRHGETTRLAEQVGQLEHALDRRAIIERAKGILMGRHGIGERDAFERLRASARAASRSVVAVAAEMADGTSARETSSSRD